MGAVSAAGLDTAATIEAFRSGQRNPGKLTLFESPVDYPVFEAAAFPARRPYGEGVRTLELTLHALREALADARLDARALGSAHLGVCLGTTVASQLNDLAFYRSFKEIGDAPLGSVRRYLKGNLAEAVAAHLGVRALTATVTNACSSGADAVAVATQWIELGLCEVAIAGGADELSRIPYCGFNALGLGCPFPCTPFDKQRQGLNLGEGAGLLVLESAAFAERRGFDPRLAVRGYGSACDAHHLTAPSPDGAGLRSALGHALDRAGIAPGDVAFVNAHGTGTEDNDLIEGNALGAVFGPSIPVLSTKGFTGHTLGAAGGLEAVFTGLALRERWLPASLGFQEQDERIPVTPLRALTEVVGDYAISTSLAFGGNNTALVIGPFPT
jgi:3-oxoacyl-(acyl-carrier-protein) synthase